MKCISALLIFGSMLMMGCAHIDPNITSSCHKYNAGLSGCATVQTNKTTSQEEPKKKTADAPQVRQKTQEDRELEDLLPIVVEMKKYCLFPYTSDEELKAYINKLTSDSLNTNKRRRDVEIAACELLYEYHMRLKRSGKL